LGDSSQNQTQDATQHGTRQKPHQKPEEVSDMLRIARFAAGILVGGLLLSIPLFRSHAISSTQVSVIVELKDEPAAVYKARTEKSGGAVSNDQLKAYRDGLIAKQADFLKAVAANGIGASLVSRDVKGFDGSVTATVPLQYSLVLNGMAMKIDESKIAALRSMPEVKRVSSDELLTLNLNNSVPYTRAPEVYGRYAEVSQFDTQNEGYEGQGMYVSIIDTGIDWTHPMFGGDPTPPRLAVMPAGPTQSKTNQKVVYYLPLTDVGVEDGFGHGTHVASTVAGYLAQTQDGTRIHGMAPQAKLLSYKVCSDVFSSVYSLTGVPLGGCESSNTIMAIEDSVSPFTLNNAALPKPVAHVINMSLGGGGGPDNPTAVAASNAALAGCVVVAASGNHASGPAEGTTGSPAAGTHVISVGATTHPGNLGNVYQLGVVGGPQGMIANKLSGSAAVPANLGGNYVFCGFCDTPDQVPASVSGRIALAQRGSTVDASAAGTGVLVNKAAQAAAKGAIAIVVYNNVDGELTGVNAFAATIPVLGLSKVNGETLKSLIGSTTAGAVSPKPVQVRKTVLPFMGDIAGFSNWGPVRGLGQVKPDISAPGVQVLAAVPPASLIGGLAASTLDPQYYHLDGTSMASPHAAGAATLIKQAHLDWTPDVVRTVLINTATNMRDQSGAPKGDGPDADSIIAQGGGLIDVRHAVNAKALMGVAGDGIDEPAILGSHSFGEVPVVNNRITYTAPITVTIRDMSGEGGNYNLNVANNRDLQLAGINVSASQSTVSVPANGSATFTVSATFNGDQIRDVMAAKTVGTSVIFEKIQMQWFVTATRSDNQESLRMPFFFRPGSSLPAQPIIQTLTQTATVPAGSYGTVPLTTSAPVVGDGSSLANGVTYVDVPFSVSDSTYQVEATTTWFDRPSGSQEDIDYLLLDPTGKVIASSGGPAGASEYVKVRVSRGGTYTHRLVGYLNAATDVTVTTNLSKGPDAPTAQPIPGDFVDSQNRNVDFDGSVTLNWTPTGSEQGFEIETSSSSSPDWSVVADVPANTTSYNFNNLANDTYAFRVRGIQPGQIGKYVTNPGNTASVVVDARSKVDITSLITYPISNISFTGGVWQQDFNLVNNTTNTYVPYVDFNVIGISTPSVSVINADNGGSGVNPSNAALFSFSSKLGSDQLFSPAETTAARTIRFQDSSAAMFSWDVQVTAYVSSGAPAGGSSSQSSQSSGSTASSGGLPNLPLTKVSAVMRFTANPLTRTVTSKLIKLN